MHPVHQLLLRHHPLCDTAASIYTVVSHLSLIVILTFFITNTSVQVFGLEMFNI